MRPTEYAEIQFQYALNDHFTPVATDGQNDRIAQIAAGLANLAAGLWGLSTGLRATYILLDEVKGLLERQGARR